VQGGTGSVTGAFDGVVVTLHGNEVSGSDGMVRVGMVTCGTVTGGTVIVDPMDVEFCDVPALVEAEAALEVVDVEVPFDFVAGGNGTNPDPLR